jgi:hypothetical protein
MLTMGRHRRAFQEEQPVREQTQWERLKNESVKRVYSILGRLI